MGETVTSVDVVTMASASSLGRGLRQRKFRDIDLKILDKIQRLIGEADGTVGWDRRLT
ncbi:hypothetical protein [Mesorhizobium comanense]|uniref:hypothetical protein n=1 Tax=Mesorhizobium comanense TaxID=2502215 RepID=UPI00148591BC|nr:hypothetical protein [Mesorhizobium comanense]